MQINPDVLQQPGRLTQNPAEYLNALEIDEVFDQLVEYQISASGFAAAEILTFKEPKTTPPQFLAFTRAILSGDEVLTPLPTLGFGTFDGNEFPVFDYTVASATTTEIIIESFVASPFVAPIQILVYVLKDKSGSDKISLNK